MLGPRARVALWIAIGLGGALSLWLFLRQVTGATALAPLDLGALTLDLPEGATVQGSYTYGTVAAMQGVRAAVVTRWQPGAIPSDAVIAHGERLAAETQGAKDVRVSTVTRAAGGLPTRSTSTRAEGYASEDTKLVCGGLVYSVRTLGPEETIDALQDAIVASARCHPDPSHAGDLAGPPVVVPLPPGWVAAPAKEGQVYALFRGDGASLTVQSLVIASPDRFTGQVEASSRETATPMRFGERESVATAGGPRDLWPIDVGGVHPMGGTSGLWRCGDDGPWINAQVLAPVTRPYAGARELVLAIRCREPGEAAPSYPAGP